MDGAKNLSKDTDSKKQSKELNSDLKKSDSHVRKKESEGKKDIDSGDSDSHKTREDKKRDKKHKKEKKNKNRDGPMHFTASSEPISISLEVDGTELPPEVFAQVSLPICNNES